VWEIIITIILELNKTSILADPSLIVMQFIVFIAVYNGTWHGAHITYHDSCLETTEIIACEPCMAVHIFST
jgi:hypothetical protein